MKFVLILSAVLLTVFLGQSNAAVGSKVVGSVLGSSLSSSLEKAIEEAEQGVSYEANMRAIKQLGSEGSNEKAGKIAEKGLNEGMALLKKSFEEAFEGVKDVSESVRNTSPENLIQSLKSTFDKTYKLMIEGGAKAYMTLGQVAQIVGQSDCSIGEATQMLTEAGQGIFGGLVASMNIGIQGIKDGKDAATQALLATVKALQSSEEGINNLVTKITEKVKESLSKGLKPCTEDPQVVSEDNEAAEKSQLAQNAIKSLQESADKALNKASSATQKEAIQVLRDGIINAVKKLAVAGEDAYNAIEKASSIPNKDEALSIVEKGIKASEKQCIVAIAVAQLTHGRVYQIMGDTFNSPTFESMVAVELGRVEVMNALENTLQIASEGIKNDAAKSALDAAREGVATAGTAGYTQFVKSANNSFENIIKNA